MAMWLFKEEPTHYSYADLEKDGGTVWDGVENAQARNNLRQVKKGDRIFYYHTGKVKAIVAEMKALADAAADPNSDDEKAVLVQVGPVRPLKNPVTLAAVKADAELKQWELARLPRLSIMPVSAAQWKRVEQLSKGAD